MFRILSITLCIVVYAIGCGKVADMVIEKFKKKTSPEKESAAEPKEGES